MGGACGKKPAAVAAEQQPSWASPPLAQPHAHAAHVELDGKGSILPAKSYPAKAEVTLQDVGMALARERQPGGWRCTCRETSLAGDDPCPLTSLPVRDPASSTSSRQLAGVLLLCRLAEEPATAAALPLHAPGVSAREAAQSLSAARELAWDLLEEFARGRVTRAERSAEVAALASCGDPPVVRKALVALVRALEGPDPTAADYDDAGRALRAALDLVGPGALGEGALPRACVKAVVRFCARLLTAAGGFLRPAHRDALLLVKAAGSLLSALEAAGVAGAPGPSDDEDVRALQERLQALGRAAGGSWWLGAHARAAGQALLLLQRPASAADRFADLVRRTDALLKAAKSTYKLAAIAFDAAASFGVTALASLLAERMTPWEVRVPPLDRTVHPPPQHVELIWTNLKAAFAASPDAVCAWFSKARFLRLLFDSGRYRDFRELVHGAARDDLLSDGALATALAAALYDAACESPHEAVADAAIEWLGRLAAMLADEAPEGAAAAAAALAEGAAGRIRGRTLPEAASASLSALACLERHSRLATRAGRARAALEALARSESLQEEVEGQRAAAPEAEESARPTPVRAEVVPGADLMDAARAAFKARRARRRRE